MRIQHIVITEKISTHSVCRRRRTKVAMLLEMNYLVLSLLDHPIVPCISPLLWFRGVAYAMLVSQHFVLTHDTSLLLFVESQSHRTAVLSVTTLLSVAAAAVFIS